MKNAANAVVRTLQSNVSVSGRPFPAGNCVSFSGATASVTWDGKNDANATVSNGNYSIQITATDPQLNTASATLHHGRRHARSGRAHPARRARISPASRPSCSRPPRASVRSTP